MTLPDHLAKFRLAVWCGDPATPLSHSRVFGPLNQMVRQDCRLEIVRDWAGNRDWPWLGGCDALFLEAPYTQEDLVAVQRAKDLGLPVWLDYGDDLMLVDRSNAAWLAFSDVKALRENLTELLGHADVVTCATETLTEAYRKLESRNSGSKIRVLPEGCQWRPSELPRQRIITWRGLASHADDLPQFAAELISVLNEPQFKDWCLLLFGDPAITTIAANHLTGGQWHINLAVAPWFNSPWGLMRAWTGARPFLHLCPLPDTPFNRGRPPSVWLEATAVGAAVLAPDHLPEWDVPGMIRYYGGNLVTNGRANFADTLRRELSRFSQNSETQKPDSPSEFMTSGFFHPAVASARAAIYPERTMPRVNETRWEILRGLSGGGWKLF